MDYIKFCDNEITYKCTLSRLSENVIRITFIDKAPEIFTTGFYLINEHNSQNMSGDFYLSYTTLYRTYDDNSYIIELSNDSSIYVAPIIDEETTETELTEEEKAEIEKQTQISSLQLQISSLKSELASTDYIFIKIGECDLLGTTYDYTEEYLIQIHAIRQSQRDSINELQEHLNALLIEN